MDVFALRDRLVEDYRHYAESFFTIRDEQIQAFVENQLETGLLWPDPMLQLNPAFEPGGYVEGLIAEGVLHTLCERIFRTGKAPERPEGSRLLFHKHQTDAIRIAASGSAYVLTTGTGSGKSLAYMVPIVDSALRDGARDGHIKAIVVYPMNALANSQLGELEKFLRHGFPEGHEPVTFRRYTGQEKDEEREEILANPPDILLTNYVMLEYLLTRPYDRNLIRAARGLRFLVLDELHTYRGRQGSDVALLIRRVRDACRAERLQVVGTSATLAGPGTLEQQREQVAAVSSRLFGTTVEPACVVGETLREATRPFDASDPSDAAALRERVGTGEPPSDHDSFIADPVARWIERTIGIRPADDDPDRLVRCQPRSLTGTQGIAPELAALTSVPERRCIDALKATLMAGSSCIAPNGFRVFAFRLHQFLSGGSTVSASLGDGPNRYLSTSGQQYVPGDRSRALLPLAFCRACGQEYYSVREVEDAGRRLFEPREISERSRSDGERNGYLYISTEDPWDPEAEGILDKLPADWVEPDTRRVKRSQRENLPQAVNLDPQGYRSDAGQTVAFIPAPFRFCVNCGVAYSARAVADFGKLATLGAGGRSTSTTVLGLAAVRTLREDSTLEPEARKLLSFTDNRQDASLQAGHFNDFVEVGLLRSALYRAASEAGEDGLRYDELGERVCGKLALQPEHYAADPGLKGGPKRETDTALREVVSYRVYRDLERGWRLTSPNLEQTGLLTIHYSDLEDACVDEEIWAAELPDWYTPEDGDRDPHGALVTATADQRLRIAKTLLDYLRRELAVKADPLDPDYQEGMRTRSNARLIQPWAIDEQERLTPGAVAYPRPRSGEDERAAAVYISPRGGFGSYLRRRPTFPDYPTAIDTAESRRLIAQLLGALQVYGLVEPVRPAGSDGSPPGFQVPAAQIRWVASDGTEPFHDAIRMPQAPSTGGNPNAFFQDLYRGIAADGQGIEAREHTAQVNAEIREKREESFRSARLPLLFCSPTMELGVDIASLNVVNMRNVPPTPANYAQRSGRAGRSGQPALVYTFCSTWNSHDQYFFRRPERMVSGQVAPPQLDLANEDLVRAHVHAIWLAETGASLKQSLTEILDVSGSNPSLELLSDIRAALDAGDARHRARTHAAAVLTAAGEEIASADWYDEAWLDRTLANAVLAFDQACERWRALYRSALGAQRVNNEIVQDASRSLRDKNEAKRLRREAESQLELLAAASGPSFQSDFYSYRYFASEGFLPGYNFPRLPLSAYIPARRNLSGDDEYVSRPRFLAIREFGPQNIIYHEGARYIVNKVILPVANRPDQEGLPTDRAKLCTSCGYLHEIGPNGNPDLCERCGTELAAPMSSLLRMQNVATKRRDRISSDEEERQRQGFELLTAMRFSEHHGGRAQRTGEARTSDSVLARLDYGQAATIWHVNLGWARRANRDQLGFVLDTERGYWARNEQEQADDPDDPLSKATRRVVPYVEDHRNCLLFAPTTPLGIGPMASLQAALKRGVQAVFQLEDQELAAEPLPTPADRRVLLLYESAEGGAGVLRRLLDDPTALAHVAREALEICHFNPDTGEDRHRAAHATEDCDAACYDCLFSYSNQRDHRLLDRKLIRDTLLQLTGTTVSAAPGQRGPDQHIERLRRLCDSQLEQSFLDLLQESKYRIPSDAQRLIQDAAARPDFLYHDHQVAVFIDGPPHDNTVQAERDGQATARLEDLGWTVIRLHHDEDWPPQLAQYPSVFGRPTDQPRP